MVTVQSVDNHVTSINTANTSSTIIHLNGIYTILYLLEHITNNIHNQVISFHVSKFQKKNKSVDNTVTCIQCWYNATCI